MATSVVYIHTQPNGWSPIAPQNGGNANNVEAPSKDVFSAEMYKKSRRKPSPEYEKAHPYVRHQGENRQYMRDIILGVNDGLVSMFLITIGIVGGGLTTKQVLLTGITGAVAGAISMALGEYMATKSQREVRDGDLELERDHFKHHRHIELDEVEAVLKELNFEGELLDKAVATIGSKDESLLRFMSAFEFGFTEEDDRNPLMASMFSGMLFIVGSLPSVIPFACTSDVNKALYATIALCGISLFAVGALKTMATRTKFYVGGVENLLVGRAASAISYGIGALYDYGQGH